MFVLYKLILFTYLLVPTDRASRYDLTDGK